MRLLDVIQRQVPPLPWAEGEKIPWNEPGFSQRMLREHLSQAHDAASRRAATIDRHVAWIHGHVLAGMPSRVLDLGCGPGLYASRLARLGHTCRGIDFSPASLAYAREQAEREGLACDYVEADIRLADFGSGHDLAMLIYGEFNVFRPEDAAHILTKAWAALAPGGRLLLEPHTFEAVRQIGVRGSSWTAAVAGLFSPTPHLCLEEHFWHAEPRVAINRWYIVEAASGQVTRYADSMQAYTDAEYVALLETCGFEEISFHPSLSGSADDRQPELLALTARKRAA